MLVFPNSKINLGLHVVAKRPDGFHNIESVFYPLNWCDALEVLDNPNGKNIEISQSGLAVDGKVEDNLIYKAWQLLSAHKSLPALKVHLHKHIPMGAGLGGGSADAAFFINLVNTKCGFGLNETERLALASELGSDCAFFIKNKPVMALGRGNEFSPIKVDLSSYYILAIYPGIHSNTREAYSGLSPKAPAHELRSIVEGEPVSSWKDKLVNDFEETIFKKYPAIKALKANLYEGGALYASMSGSGSAVYGIFETEPPAQLWENYLHCLQKPAPKIL